MRMNQIVSSFLLTALLLGCGASKNIGKSGDTAILAHIDLLNVRGDKVEVTVDPGPFTTSEVVFYIPKTVPGTYSIDNYGKYIDSLVAWDYKGGKLAVIQVDENSWKVNDAAALDKVTYLVNDTYDSEREQAEAVFSPAGTNIKAGENFMLNLHGFIGYFENLQEIPYEISLSSPSEMMASTSLPLKDGASDPGNFTFTANRYFEVIDNPILVGKPNTEEFQIKDIKVVLSVYSPNGVYSAADLKGPMQRMMMAQKNFLGDIDGTREYNILLYLSTLGEDDASGFGALEHHTSTVVVLPEQMPRENLEQAMVDVVSHEFFHIVTPLNVHSREVHYFDFNDPQMSRHLWMYEGTTEYFANLFQIQQGLIDEAEFYERMMNKISSSQVYDDSMSFTEMSSNILNPPYKENYANVYEKGALINMALDILLRELSGGEKGVLWLMKQLSQKYDVNNPFEDDKLFDEIVAMTYPEVGEFFATYVEGDTPIDYKHFLGKVGLTTTTTEQPSGYFLRDQDPFIDVDPKQDDAIFIREGIALNSFFEGLGAQGGDYIESINGTDIDLEAIRPIIGQSFAWTPDTEITMVVKRGEEVITLEGKAGTPTVMVPAIIPSQDASPEQLALRQAWLKG